MTVTYLPASKAAALMTGAMKKKTVAERLRASAAVIAKLDRIAAHPDVPFAAFLEKYLRDCLEAKQLAPALGLVERLGFSAEQQRELLEVVVALYLAAGKTKQATDWIGDVSYVFGAKAVAGLAAKPGFAALAKSKAYLKMAGKDAEKNFFLAHLAEIQGMWKRGDYDNWKDALQDATGLVKDAKKLGTKLRKADAAKASAHFDAVVAKVEKEMKKDPALARYLKGL